MAKDLSKEALNILKVSFESVKHAALSLGKSNFPEIDTIEKNLKRARKYNSEERVEELLKSYRKELEPYFHPELFFDNKVCFSYNAQEQQKNDSERKFHREEKRIENMCRRVDEMKLESEHNREEAWRSFLEISAASDHLSEKKPKVRASYNEFNIPSLEEVKENERNDITPETWSYCRQIYNKQDLLTEYQNYWIELCECITFDPIDTLLYIRVSDYWTRKELKILYSLLIAEGYIESGKEASFLAIFSGFYYDHLSEELPIKWLCKSKYIGSSDTSSNLTMLYYLVSALKGWTSFKDFLDGKSNKIVKEFLTSEEKRQIAKYFIHENGEKIVSTTLMIHTNSECIAKIKELFSHFPTAS